MAGFLAVVTDVLADDDRPDDLVDGLPDNDGNGDDRRYTDLGSRHKRHLGLGFSHGMSDGAGKLQEGSNSEGNRLSSRHNDECNGNGHAGIPNGNGHGHANHGNGNGFGNRDCGEPSPSD